MIQWLAFVLVLDPSTEAARVRSAMQEAIDAQKQSVAVQAKLFHKEEPKPKVYFATCVPLPLSVREAMITSTGRTHGVSPNLIREVARQESGFQPCVTSRAGAQGLMQLMPRTQYALGVDNPFDPEQSMDAGVRLLRQLLDRYKGNITLALSAYNAGTAVVDRKRAVPQIAETHKYVKDILARMRTMPAESGTR